MYEYQYIFINQIARASIKSELDAINKGDLSDSVATISKMAQEASIFDDKRFRRYEFVL